MNTSFAETLSADFCVVGGGMAGLCAAVAAARHGAKTILVQDRPVLGGNASSEVRMWICGAHGSDNKESGILEEIMLHNLRWNPSLNFNTWDHLLQYFVQSEPNLKLLLNTTCHSVETSSNVIKSIKAWQITTQTEFTIEAKFFADCSGDSILRMSGAEFRSGRESSNEFNESHAPAKPDPLTMGNSILFQLKEVSYDRPYTPPPWAYKYSAKDMEHRRSMPTGDNFWWLEYGGVKDTIKEAEEIRDELLKIGYGVWDFIKNHPDGRGKGFELEWMGAVPGKRENIRYVGDHVLNQNDVEAEGRFEDIVAYGGWSMDDHHPEAFYYRGAPTIFHPAPSPFGIPFRCLYSKNISNLYFAGRNISATHMAMSSTRVMATCAIMGQAIGTAAAIGVKENLSPRQIFEKKIKQLQNTLMDDDCYLPWKKREISEITRQAALSANGDAEALRNGLDRSIGENGNLWTGKSGNSIEYKWNTPVKLKSARIVLDSDFSNVKRMPCFYPASGWNVKVPAKLLKKFKIEIKKTTDSNWETVASVEENIKRLVNLKLDVEAVAVRLVPEESWKGEEMRIFSFDVN